ncbi:MAG TPA: DUF4190 domain-containing protein [Candidatus Ventrimonas merdavium]|nr:DUF4190 domain-containing protein [Candidatus Ventrimonas merdavium]
MNETPHAGKPLSQRLPLFSLLAGIIGILFCCTPPVQLILGAAAVLLAWVSKNGRPYTRQSKAGLILGILSILCSILVFGNFVMAMNLIEDPANAELIRDLYDQTRDLMESIAATQAQ